MPPKGSARPTASRGARRATDTRKRAAEDTPSAAKRARTTITTLNAAPAPVPALHESDLELGKAGERTMGAIFHTQGALTPTSGDVVARKLFVWGTGEAGQHVTGQKIPSKKRSASDLDADSSLIDESKLSRGQRKRLNKKLKNESARAAAPTVEEEEKVRDLLARYMLANGLLEFED